MVDDTLFDDEHVSFSEYAVTPKEDHTKTDSAVRAEKRDAFTAELTTGPTDAVVLTHGDADGLTSAALVVGSQPGDAAVATVDYSGPYRLDHALADIYEHRDILGTFDLFVLDYNYDGNDAVAEVLADLDAESDVESVQWFDHHQWESDLAARLRDLGVTLTVDDDECTATLLVRELDYEFSEALAEVAEVTKDYDLWIREDPRSGRLQTYSYIADASEYIATVRENGMDFPDEVDARIDAEIEEDEALRAEAVERADWHEVNGWTVAITYIRGGTSAEIGNELVEDEGADVAVVQKPHTGMSIYSHSNEEEFTRCHEVADMLGGGGHPTAAGCDFTPSSFRELAEYWASAGESKRDRVFKAIYDVTQND